MNHLLKLTAFLSGLIFGLGLLASGFFNPNNVLAFFDVFGDWKAGLMITFILSIAISAVGFKTFKNKSKSLMNQSIHLPDTQRVNQKLILGSALFGVGWGIAGICPGPALVLIGSLKVEVIYFFIGLIPGIFFIALIQRKSV